MLKKSNKRHVLKAAAASVYPGAYVPASSQTKLKKESTKFSADNTQPLSFSLQEFEQEYLIEAIIPGVNREDFHIESHGHQLSITLLHKEGKPFLTDDYELHENPDVCFRKELTLPDDADTEFLTAEYRQGVLRLHLPKSTCPLPQSDTCFVVY